MQCNKYWLDSQNVAFGDYARPASGPTPAAPSARNKPPYSSLRSPPPPTPLQLAPLANQCPQHK